MRTRKFLNEKDFNIAKFCKELEKRFEADEMVCPEYGREIGPSYDRDSKYIDFFPAEWRTDIDRITIGPIDNVDFNTITVDEIAELLTIRRNVKFSLNDNEKDFITTLKREIYFTAKMIKSCIIKSLD